MTLNDLGDTLRNLLLQVPRVLKNPRYLISGKTRRQMRYEELKGIRDPRERFTRIYDSKVWRGSESASGAGSSIETTREIRRQLPQIADRYDIGHVLDAPCGDFHWMKEMMQTLPELQYTGGDIVQRLVEKNQRQFGSERIRFQQLDITGDTLPSADLMLVRDCLLHLSYADISRFLMNLARSDIDLLLTTSNVIEGEDIQNRDIESGDFRPIDLFTEPFCFPQEHLESFDDHDVSTVGKRMYLFRVPALIDHLSEYSALYRSQLASDETL